MSKISAVTPDIVVALQKKIRENIQGRAAVEEAAQKFTEVMYEAFQDSIVLVRLFAALPFEKLPAPNQAFVTKLATSQGIAHLVNDQMLVLSLLGTYGEEGTWRDRHSSRGHVGVPLASVDFIDRIPMMARLLREMGLELNWIDRQDTKIVAKTTGKMAGVFYVPDARTAVDQQGRSIISAQDFVNAYKVRTVFGLGGSYLTTGTFITIIIFTREALEKYRAEQFMFLVNEFKTATMHLLSSGKLFTQ
jgi:hypothetical protein